MKKSILIDTNLLLDEPNIIFKLADEHEKVIIPLTVLKELDKHKFNKDLSYSARSAIHAIRELKDTQPDKLTLVINEDSISENDERIIEAARENGADIATKDISMSLMSEAKGVDCTLYGVVREGLSDPYIKMHLNDLPNDFSYAQYFQGNKYYRIIEDLSEVLNTKLDINAWFFIFMSNGEEDVYLYANHPLDYKLIRIDNLSQYRSIETDISVIKALDWYQICALYGLTEAPNVILTGKWGSGKTLLGTASTIASGKRKTFITRPPIGINKNYDIGFLPGDKDDKMADWFAGFMSALYYIYANTRDQKDRNGKTFDFVKEEVFNKKFETVPINAIQGMSLLEGDTLMVDEVQLVDVDYLSMILSRSSEGSKMILMGDLSQTYDVVRPSESGLLKLLRILPHRSICHVNLKLNYRSELVELADQLQDKTF